MLNPHRYLSFFQFPGKVSFQLDLLIRYRCSLSGEGHMAQNWGGNYCATLNYKDLNPLLPQYLFGDCISVSNSSSFSAYSVFWRRRSDWGEWICPQIRLYLVCNSLLMIEVGFGVLTDYFHLFYILYLKILRIK